MSPTRIKIKIGHPTSECPLQESRSKQGTQLASVPYKHRRDHNRGPNQQLFPSLENKRKALFLKLYWNNQRIKVVTQINKQKEKKYQPTNENNITYTHNYVTGINMYIAGSSCGSALTFAGLWYRDWPRRINVLDVHIESIQVTVAENIIPCCTQFIHLLANFLINLKLYRKKQH